MTTETKAENEYRPINPRLLGNGFKFNFNLYYKTHVDGQVKFLKFADQTDQHKNKIQSLIDSGDLEEELFVREMDMMGYYQQATEVLREYIVDTNISFEEKTGQVYDLSKDIMNQFFQYQVPTNLLKMADPVMEMMDQVLSQKTVGFAGLGEILNKDYYTYTHSVNVGLYCMTYATKIGMPSIESRELGMGGMLHDVGKVEVPMEILNKVGKLTDQEFVEMKKHPEAGRDMLNGMGCFGGRISQMAYEHHEKFSGNGYPQGLNGENISFEGRICKVMDVYDALTTRRAYKAPMTPFKALDIMINEMGPEFDINILNQFVKFLGQEA
ncbi:MAG: HD-GYP domain-containing protein [Candidatus Nitronauta litoralis]|uniref:HD-GYP domain-containing protein n=1 Tax=Candidatus Nitronauta litoralis TaxID=2705533 RepID=A0A7T0BTL7_9BACT|nr:MAG: HD-GYP domain-containing protein [Candidatus Nitronauta litoralis]